MILTRDLMHGYQNRTVDFICNTTANVATGCALWLDMGLGKTVSTATACVDMMQDFTVGRVLIVAPKRVALTTWPLELRNWDHLMNVRYSVISGDKKQRIQAILKRSDFHIISRDNLAWLVTTVGNQWPWDMVVIDESSSFKNPQSNRFKAIKKALSRITRVVELSATPAPLGLQDLWAQFFILDKGERLGVTQKSFKQRWFFEDREKHLILPKSHTKEEIYERVSDITIHMDADDYLEMPELIHNPVYVTMPTDKVSLYKKFEKELVMEIEKCDFNIEIEASNAAVLTGKLLQFANGTIYIDKNRNYELLHDEKIEAVKEIVETHYGYPVLIAYSFQADLERLKKAFPEAVVMDDDPDTQVKWNNGEIPILLTHPASSGHGLNLQKGSNIIVWFGLPWSLEYFLQLIGRLLRQGQTRKSVIMHLILSIGTVDERVYEVLKMRDADQKDLLNAVKMIE